MSRLEIGEEKFVMQKNLPSFIPSNHYTTKTKLEGSFRTGDKRKAIDKATRSRMYRTHFCSEGIEDIYRMCKAALYENTCTVAVYVFDMSNFLFLSFKRDEKISAFFHLMFLF